MVKGIVDYFPESTGKKADRINLISGWVEPADMREIKRLCWQMGVDTILFPDTSDVLDAPQTGEYEFYAKGGVTVAELKQTGASSADSS